MTIKRNVLDYYSFSPFKAHENCAHKCETDFYNQNVHSDIWNHILVKQKQITSLKTCCSSGKLAYKVPHPNDQVFSLTSHLFKLTWQTTSVTCQSIKEARCVREKCDSVEDTEEEEGDPVLLMKSPLVWTAAVSTQGGLGLWVSPNLSLLKRRMCIVSYSDTRVLSV